jgi:hypothetical protein
MSLIHQFDNRWLLSPRDDAIREAGGMWIPNANTIKTREVIAEAAERGVRALAVHEITPELAEQLPDLEFLGCGKIDPDLSLITPLHQLRSLSFDAFAGRLDLAAFPRLERRRRAGARQGRRFLVARRVLRDRRRRGRSGGPRPPLPGPARRRRRLGRRPRRPAMGDPRLGRPSPPSTGSPLTPSSPSCGRRPGTIHGPRRSPTCARLGPGG